jgi:hypothetical protein
MTRIVDCVVEKLRQEKIPVTKENYALFAYWKPYKKLDALEKLDVRKIVYEANIQ